MSTPEEPGDPFAAPNPPVEPGSGQPWPAPAADQPAPGYGEAGGGYGQQPPAYGQQPPAYGQQPPAYGQQPPAYGQAYGQQPPAYGQQPPAYGQQPPTYGQAYGQVPGYGAAPYPPGPAYGPYGMDYPKNSLAVWSLALGIASFVLCGPFTAIPGVILGMQARKAVDQGLANNRGMATAGVVLGWVAIGLSIVTVVWWVIVAAGAFSGWTPSP